jgi:ADP-heptose:LPS heptosyltransferase
MTIAAKPWNKKTLPKRILAIRLQAMGDVVITLPYLQDLRNRLPASVQIDFLTRVETEPVPRNLILFNKIFSIAGKRNLKLQLLYTLLLLPHLFFRRYDVILDLQNNILSRLVRKILRPAAWVEFDRHSPLPAGDRTKNTIEAAGLGIITASHNFVFNSDLNAKQILLASGWDGKKDLIVLNPAGAFETRNWPIENYVGFAKLWLKEYPQSQFLIIGLPFMSAKACYLDTQLGDDIINLTGKTTAAEAFCILQYAKLVLSEDSGLMHMAWVSGIPTFALFGGSRSDKARPLGKHSAFLDSTDLPCGSCMQEKCRWGDTRCLTRYSPVMVFEKAIALLKK